MRYLLIDLSYYVFYRYFAIVNYIKLSTKTTPNLENVLENKEFMTKFDEMFEKSLLKIVKQNYGIKNLALSSDLQIIFAKDCSRANIWRQDHFQGYKACRDHVKKKDHFDGLIFEHVYSRVLPQLMKKYYSIHEFYVDRAEADDCIAVLIDCIQNENPQNDIIIITNDNDYLQLMNKVHDIINLQGKSLKPKLIDGCSKKTMLSKILIGDPSDNIKGVLSKSKANHILNQCKTGDMIDQFVGGFTPQQKENYEFNTKMIDFNYMPTYVKDNIIKTYHNHTFINADLCFCKLYKQSYEKNCTLPP